MLTPGYGPLLIMVAISLIVPIGGITLSRLLQPRMATPVKYTTFECGVEPIGGSWVQYTVRYYMYALVFLIFDIETVFLYPWAIASNQLGTFAIIEMFIFLTILVLGLAYAWKKGDLEWVH